MISLEYVLMDIWNPSHKSILIKIESTTLSVDKYSKTHGMINVDLGMVITAAYLPMDKLERESHIPC